jgi:hypothetical protein
LSFKSLTVGIDQKLIRVEAVPGIRLVGAVHPIAVNLSRRDIRKIAVKDVFGAFRQRDPLYFVTIAVEQTQFDFGRVSRK